MKYNLTSKPPMPLLREGFDQAILGASDFAATCCKIYLGMLINRPGPGEKNLIGNLNYSNQGKCLYIFSENKKGRLFIREKLKEVRYEF